ncbi:MAG: mitochondrial fission ELM1 family protein [Pseudomonadota bacterium]
MSERQNPKQKTLSVWVITDGKIGDDVQCLAVARGLADTFEKKIARPRPPWEWMAPWGPPDPREAPSRAGGAFGPPFPDVLFVSGRRAIPCGLAVKRASGGASFLAIMKDPRFGRARADLVWTPAHDRFSGNNVFKTLTSPHGLREKIQAAREQPLSAIASLDGPILGVCLGGPSRGAQFDAASAAMFAEQLNVARKDFASIAITPSRRTPPGFVRAIRDALSGDAVYIWDGDGDNPYIDILARSDALIVTADSHNMMSEAVATGIGVYAWRPKGLAPKLAWFVSELEKQGAVRSFDGPAAAFRRPAIDATQEIVAEIERRMRARA